MSALLLGCISRARQNQNGWNPSDKGANIALSGNTPASNATATGGTAAWQSVRAVTGRSTGLFAFEIIRTADPSTLTVLGLADSTMSLANFIGSGSGNCIGYNVGSRLTSGTFSGNATITSPAIGQAVLFCVDMTNRKGYIFVEGQTNWEGGYPGNPLIATSPAFTWTSFGAGNLFPAASVFNSSAAATIITRKRRMHNAAQIPSSFAEWG